MPSLSLLRMGIIWWVSFQLYGVIPIGAVTMIILGFIQSHRSCQFLVRFKDNFILEAPIFCVQLSMDMFLKRYYPRMNKRQRIYVRGLLREGILWAFFIHQGGLNFLDYRGQEGPRKKICYEREETGDFVGIDNDHVGGSEDKAIRFPVTVPYQLLTKEEIKFSAFVNFLIA